MAPPKPSQFTPTSKVYFSEAYTPTAGGLSLVERQEVLHRAAQGFEGGREALESWSRKDLLQLICLEMGKERKYTGVSKSKMVELLLKLVSTKGLGEGRGLGSSGRRFGPEPSTPQFVMQGAYRRQRKVGRPARVPSTLHTCLASDGNNDTKVDPSSVCKNTACKAHLPQGTSFCQRCSCCVCKKFDDNKDPSLWIVCTPEPHNAKTDCRLSCHIECALSSMMAGVVVEGSKVLLDGGYRCSCGKISSLIGCWKKQLVIAKDARRVDTLCQRLSLSYRLLNETVKHTELHELVVKAVQTLEAEVGSITEGSAKFARGLVNRLSSSGDVLDLVNMALEKADALHEELVINDGKSVLGETMATEGILHVPKENIQETEVKEADLFCRIVFDKITSSTMSLTVKGGGENVTGYRLWHRKACDPSFPNNPTCIITTNPGEAHISGLQACAEYALYVVPFFERGIGEPAEARCFTRSAELPPHKETSQYEVGHPDKEFNVVNSEKDSRLPDKLESTFKVRELGKVLHSAWAEEYQSNHNTRAGIFHGKGRLDSLISRKEEEEKKNTCISSGVMNAGSSPGAGGSHVGNGGSKPSPEKAPSSDFNVSANADLGGEESRVTVEVELPPASVRTLSRRDSSVVLQEAEVKDAQQVTDLEDTSDNPGNSHTSQREETEAISQVVSDAMQANVANHGVPNGVHRLAGCLKTKEHGESWAMQVHGARATIGMEEPQATIVRKRTSEGLGRGDGYGLVNGCGRSMGGVLCAVRNLEFCVKIVRWLECEGYLKEDFRMKFLTWFSLKASEHEKRVVSVFIDTLQDNPASLAAQLVDTFSDVISAKKHQMIANGFTNKLWR